MLIYLLEFQIWHVSHSHSGSLLPYIVCTLHPVSYHTAFPMGMTHICLFHITAFSSFPMDMTPLHVNPSQQIKQKIYVYIHPTCPCCMYAMRVNADNYIPPNAEIGWDQSNQWISWRLAPPSSLNLVLFRLSSSPSPLFFPDTFDPIALTIPALPILLWLTVSVRPCGTCLI